MNDAGPGVAFRLARSALFRLPPERAHDLTLAMLGLLPGALAGRARSAIAAPRRVMGLEFPNAVGLAAGLDKDGTAIAGLYALGFGFLELGTVTPRPQPGNPRPRLFRLPEAGALINRMGFNNRGVANLVRRVAAFRRHAPDAVLGINIGKNRDTPLEQAADDYLHCLREVYPQASYVTVNLSSPNTPGLRELQQGGALRNLLGALQRERERLSARHGVRRPLVVKLAPDLPDDALADIARALLEHEVDGVIATNTTAGRAGVENHPRAGEAGGLSGAPLAPLARQVLQKLQAELGGRVPLIAAGGLMGPREAAARFAAGAALVQLYTGLIYNGPGLIRAIARLSPAGVTGAVSRAGVNRLQ